jgi:hypothetical protein
MGVFAAQRWLADYLRRIADEIDDETTIQECAEKQLNLWGDDLCPNDTSLQRLVA